VKKILAPTDLSEHSVAGVRHALDMARNVGAEVTVYYVLSPEELMRYSRELQEKIGPSSRLPPGDRLLKDYEADLRGFLNDHFADLLPGLKVRPKVEFGDPHRNIVEEADREAVDWIVISTHGRTAFPHMAMGSVTEKVVRAARCPVLSVHSTEEVDDSKEAMA
jgi:nucleotide-binding universal stress UspA family protein